MRVSDTITKDAVPLFGVLCHFTWVLDWFDVDISARRDLSKVPYILSKEPNILPKESYRVWKEACTLLL